ncbi:MAG: cyclic nucleotide-binding protein [Candidatus Magasanikbacteria bacterium CG11_big_fil_rev_8_21_14_0_20_39_34]|uniref:Cyclic nucleotide-binding protein n=1 Tax=Candidatus Magasanikbacteria bacterium CG11_big_fil_rev_8_21_14_0_20_39_34 TaxID=1974653 RepID=A0A2H0N8P2_9BACT|nr:MAG: cyclic nucleotide-binding protein [Candidatus Magasanikbacteria bacterium CG11_big_fil_rev_8_21_14_0_20_39_34]
MKTKERQDSHPIILHKKNLTLSERMADKLTEFMGSWFFIGFFLFVLLSWMFLNAMIYINHWDPYPFILLNLVLSCLAAIQAPIILMSQNRQAQRDRLTANYDYAVNRKAEREIQNIQKDLEEIKTMISKVCKKSQKTRPTKKS